MGWSQDDLGRAIVDHIPVGVVIADSAGKVLLKNEIARRILPDPLPNQSVTDYEAWDILHPDGRPFAPEELWLRRALDGQTVDDEEARIRMPSGRETWIRGHAAPITGDDGNVSCAITTFSDISARKEAERQRDLFLGVLGHDLRNPLGVVRMSADLLRHTGGTGERPLARIGSAVTRMERLINQLLDFTRARAGTLELEPTELDLCDLFDQIAEDVRLLHPDAPIEIACANRPLHGTWDRDRVAQIAQNLITNAVEHGDRRSIQVTLCSAGDHIRLEVFNTGAPIPAHERDRIFQPFKSSRGSHGLGLYITQQFVQAHGGTIDAHSDDAGTTFTVSLPRQPP